ncbi:MAG: N-acetyltransferase [Methylocystaceae bacterium]|nr:N-acetyltransferase [Methylocystaceae bacterium]
MIKATTLEDLDVIKDIQTRAFEEPDEAELVENLLNDPSAAPILSLLAYKDDNAIGHILFTKAYVDGATAALLAPLAVDPDHHYKGTGQRLMKEGLKQLKAQGVDLVFVLGPPDYYPRVGFQNNAGKRGYPAPHPIPKRHEDAWMVINLSGTDVTGPVRVAKAISAKEYWTE